MFLSRLYGQVTVPVPSGALIKLVEHDAADLDLYAQLPEGVLSVTHFDPPRKPRVQIARTLFEDARRMHRLRFTLAHEYAHVVIHAPLYLRAGLPGAKTTRAPTGKSRLPPPWWTGWSGKPATRRARS
jgi:hypothetical protein